MTIRILKTLEFKVQHKSYYDLSTIYTNSVHKLISNVYTIYIVMDHFHRGLVLKN